MDEKIYLRDLKCYKDANEETKKHKLYCPDRCFDLSKLGNRWMVIQLDSFIKDRGMKLSPLSIRTDLYPFNLFCDFVNKACPGLDSLSDITEEELIKKAKVWLIKNGKSLTQKRTKTASGKTEVSDSDLIKYIRKIYRYLKPKNAGFAYENDRWYMKDIPVAIKNNPTKAVDSISFERILQSQIRKEIKDVIYIHLSDVALGTVTAEMTAINRFSKYLAERYPEVDSLNDIDRELLEQYLIHTHTEATGRKSYSKELCHLRSLFITAGKVFENKELEHIFYQDDIAKVPVKLYKVYSDAELKRLNAAIVDGDEQIARALVLHQLLGTRISETLTLTQDAIYIGKNGKMFVRIRQVKTGKTYQKPINDDVKNLFEKACDYTKTNYGDREYVFVNDADPDKPMQYGRIQYHIMAMVQKNNLKDDNGDSFRVGTHIWRHNYGKRLTEMHIDDVTIAKLMGHANTSSLKYYRKIGNQMLAEETRDMRTAMDDMLKEIMDGWD
ncbi:MAG: tyrosine-type recombinase/integrase [Oribacterium sp.]|nr:tyrosine-type recombinase/integrase [Oribacterium sp.]